MNSNLVVDNTTGEVMITAPKPDPYVSFRAVRCASCGHGLSQWARFVCWLFAKPVPVHVDPAWCPGGRPLSEKVSPIESMIAGQSERTFRCAGIEEPHLHYRCMACHHQWIVATKTSVTR